MKLTLLALLLMFNFSQTQASNIKSYAFRLKPGSDLKLSITNFVKEKKIRAAAVLTCVGSLKIAQIRFADAAKAAKVTGPLEIVSLVGTISKDGEAHLHISVSDAKGKTTGGHLMEGSLIYTTAEIVLVELENLEFSRVQDAQTTYKELQVTEHPRK